MSKKLSELIGKPHKIELERKGLKHQLNIYFREPKNNKDVIAGIATYNLTLSGEEWDIKGEDYKLKDVVQIREIRIIKGKDGLYLSMPAYKTNEIDPKTKKHIYKDTSSLPKPVKDDFNQQLLTITI